MWCAGESRRHPGLGGCRAAWPLGLWLAAWLVAASPASALDNPDAADRGAEFIARAQPLEQRLGEAAGGAGYAQAAAAYADFLDQELNRAYRLLLERLSGADRAALVQAQRQWLAFLAAETRFIDRRWTHDRFGTSAAIGRAGYRASLVRQRVLTLLDYLRGQPGEG